MPSNPESHANIIKEMRCANVLYGANDSHRPMTRFEKALLKLYANRLEASHKREVDELRNLLREAIEREGNRNTCYPRCVPKIECRACVIMKWRKKLEETK